MKIVQFGVSLQGVLVPKLSRIVIPRAVESYFSKISFLTLSLRIVIALPFSRNRCFQYFRIRSSLVARNISWKIVENRNYTSVCVRWRVLDELWNYFASSISFGNVADYSRIKKKKKSIFLECCAHFSRGGEIARSERVKLDSDGRSTSL